MVMNEFQDIIRNFFIFFGMYSIHSIQHVFKQFSIQQLKSLLI
jgi:hypothetical protein